MTTTEKDRLRTAIQDAIEEADIDFKCSGYQSEQNSDLSLEEWSLQDADSVVNTILGIVADYVAEVL